MYICSFCNLEICMQLAIMIAMSQQFFRPALFQNLVYQTLQNHAGNFFDFIP